MPKMKEHPRYNVLSVRVDDEMAVAVDKITTINNISPSDFIRTLISTFLEAHNGTPRPL